MRQSWRTISVILAAVITLIFMMSGTEVYAQPDLILDQPIPYSVARPFLHVRARAISPTDSTRINIRVGTKVLATFYDSINNEIDFSAYEGTALTIDLVATDRSGAVTTSNSIPIYVESSPHLIHYYSSSYPVLDVQYGRALTTSSTNNQFLIRDMVTGDSTPINLPGSFISGKITPYGALFEISQPGGISLIEFNQGAYLPLGHANSRSVVVRGAYAAWTNRAGPNGVFDSILLRDMSTGNNKLVYESHPHSASTVTSDIDVTDKGVVAFTDSMGNVKIYDNGIFKMVYQLVNPGMENSYSPVTDGHNTLFIHDLYYYNMIWIGGELMNNSLTEWIRGTSKTPVIDYQVVNGYYAYKNESTRGAYTSADFHDVLWVMDSVGKAVTVDSQLTGKRMMIDRLGANGEVMYFRDGRRLGDRQGTSTSISSTLGKSYFMDGNWYVVIGREVYRVTLTQPTVAVSNSGINIPSDSTYKFSLLDFTDQYIGPSPMAKIRITGLPRTGTLRLSGKPVNLNDEIPRDSLSRLTFVPHADSSGVHDTLTWNGTDGLTYGASDAHIAISILTVPNKPIVTGLKSVYCRTSGVQHFKVQNLPTNDPQVSVTAGLDNLPLSINKVDSTISFDPSALSVGNHVFFIYYRNYIGISPFADTFAVVAPTASSLALSANNNGPILPGPDIRIIASPVNGGLTPQFTFALDAAFQHILQGPGLADTLILSPTRLQPGDNKVFVRMLTSTACQVIVTDSIAIHLTLAPPIPVIGSLKETYCRNEGVIRLRIVNYPDTMQHYIILPNVDGNAFVASLTDSSIYLNTANLDTGVHSLHVRYSNIAGMSDTTMHFRVNDTSTVTLALHTDLTHVTSPGPSATLTATSGKSGNAPLYTFAADRTFQTILQAQGIANTYTVDASKLQVGDNQIYARVISNAPCPLTPTAMDSIVITRDAVTGLYDPDQPGRQIMVFPNPTLNDLHLTGLLQTKSYTLKLVSSDGRVLRVQTVKGSTNVTMDTRNLSAGLYYLRLQDDTKRKLLGTMGIYKK